MMRFLALYFLVFATQCRNVASVICWMEEANCESLRQAYYRNPSGIFRVRSYICGTRTNYACDLLRDYCGINMEGGSEKKFRECINLPQLRAEALVQTNYIRSRHGEDVLVEIPEMNRLAQKWAEYMADMDTLETANQGYGENLWYSEGGPKYTKSVQAQKAVNTWYAERKNWDYQNSKSKGPETGHFTQLVWSRTSQVGHGFATNDDCSKIYMVAFYNPPGNDEYGFEYNVWRPN